ncbi:Cysteine/Histidine-rich C1 domain family protein, putative [Theobroma cacao]|uniref:Cysteine/Histidine-rich C1 domain family protein, putative n=1 Tax=Theobroma cacao TaxID=3641 RepID=A0A061EZ82_THECC|nr:Cysteine/Histidine-rich C1 domain family protein, putative [Theobroma cacao]
MDLKHICHHHPLVFTQAWRRTGAQKKAYCSGCCERVKGPFYCCTDCKFYLHETCAQLELLPEISHPFHPPHPLILLPKSPNSGSYKCDFCLGGFSGLVYHCASCEFHLDINCASIAGSFDKLEHPVHEHPLILIEKHDKIVKGDCLVCKKELSSGPICKCLDCRYVYLRKKCAELPREIYLFHDRRHPLILLQNPPMHSKSCFCYLCKIQWKGFVYYCYICEFGLTLEDVSSLPVIKAANHDHPWTLLSRPMSFICDFCGTDCDRTPYLCTKCNFIVHKNCISLPCTITIMRRHHPLSHSYSLTGNQFKKCECKICHKEVNTGYGSYYCTASDCNYVSHVNCATDKSIWDPKNEDGRSEGEFMNLVTDVIQTICIRGDVIAAEIKHGFHDDNLILTFSGEVKDDSNGDGCLRPISTPFYGCKQCCGFFLHRNCAELPTEKRHPSHKHLLALTKNEDLVSCHACGHYHHGFSYKCKGRRCFGFQIDIQCSLLSDSFRHASHEHPLFLDHNCEGNCSACSKKIQGFYGNPSLGYKCMQGCKFILDFWCLTLPQIAWYKYNKHPFTLTYDGGSNTDQFYCDISEKERDPNQWFYYCNDSDNTVHPRCILGDLPFIKLGRTLKSFFHPRQLTFVKNIWNCPPCNVCKKLCNVQAIQCTECNILFHWECLCLSLQSN